MKALIYIVLIFVSKYEEVGSCASSGSGGDNTEYLRSGANDIVVVEQDDGTLKSTILHVQVCNKSYKRKKLNYNFQM